MSEIDSAESDNSDSVGKKKKYLSKPKVFCFKWMDNEKFAGWLKPVEGDKFKCKCECCNKILTCGKTQILRHSETAIHRKNVINIRRNKNLTDFVQNESERKKVLKHKKNIQSLELALSLFFAEHNIALQNVDHLVELLKKYVTDSKIIADMELKRTKCTGLIKNVLAKVENDKLVKVLQTQKFSILCDESTDISTSKQLCILARYFDVDDEAHPTVGTQLLELCHLDGKDGSAKQIYKVFKESLEAKGIPLNNLVGLATDGANVMVGEMNSFYSHLRNDVPHVQLLKCICHPASIVASKACQKLPRGPEDLMRQIYSYISGSSKRCDQLTEIQEFLQEEQLKILKLSTTSWLSMHQCVCRILIHWEALTMYFRAASFEDKLLSSDTILKQLEDKCIKCYLLFLKYSLNYMDTFNALLQSRKVIVKDLQQYSIKLFLQVCQNFIKGNILATSYGNNYLNIVTPHNYLPLEKVYSGPECESLLKTLPDGVQHDVRIHILEFYICLAKEMIQRLPLANDIFKEIELLKPEYAFNKSRSILVDLPLLTEKYKSFIDVSKVALEWRSLPFAFSDDEIRELSNMTIDAMWHKIKIFTDFNGVHKFQNLGSLASIILTLPHSNAKAERIFSVINDVKTRKRNRMGDDTLNAICVLRSSLTNNCVNCASYKINETHLKLCNNNNIYNN